MQKNTCAMSSKREEIVVKKLYPAVVLSLFINQTKIMLFAAIKIITIIKMLYENI